MRIVLAVCIAALLSSFATSSHAATSDREKLAKLVQKHAVPANTIFTPAFKPKVACYCVTNDEVGFLATDDGTELFCVVPTSFTAEGNFTVIDYSCGNFEILPK
jgi:hypothetical protein